MSDDSQQKGWDTWFSAEQDSSGGEAQALNQGVPQTPPESVPETEAEQTNWTVPTYGSAQEARQAPSAAETQQVAQPQQVTQAAESVPPQRAGQAADAAPTEQVQAAPDALPTQRVAPEPLAAPPAPPAAPAKAPPTAPAPTGSWQPPQPAQVWGPAPQAAVPQQQAPQNPQGAYAAMQQQAQPQGYGQVPPQAPAGDEWAGWEDPERRRSASPAALAADGSPPRSRRKLFMASGIGAAAIVGLATVLVLNQGSLTGSAHASATPKPSGFQPTGSSVAGDAEQTAAAFLSAWESGNFKQAASYTDNSASALSTLTSYETGLNLNGLQLAATGSTVVSSTASTSASGVSSGGTGSTSSASAAAAAPSSTAGVVTFSVVAKVGLPASSTSSTSSASASASASASGGASSSASSAAVSSSVTADWSYASKLTAYKKNGGWWIQWDPALVAPNLTASEKLVSLAVAPSASKVVDASGNDLSSATDAGVHNIAAALKRSAPSGQGTPGVEIELETASGTPITSSADVLSQPVDTGVVNTTINPKVEAAAQAAVLKYAQSSMVVLQPSTGDILAVANNDGGNDFALTARIAPGSTNKIITATALLANNLISSPSQGVACPKSITVDGTVFANSQNESEPATTPFLDDFAVSCNNAFGQWYSTIGSTTLAQTAEKYYGLNEQWNFGTGIAGPYYNIPSSASNGELFQELFGQGQLETAPLAMASVAATVDTGSFKQPIVVPGTTQVTATPLPSTVQQNLWTMMKAVTTQSNGTAYNLFSAVNSTVYGKTGTADVGSTQTKPNSWMVVFDPTLDLAIACVVLSAGYGASFAGPETEAVLQSLQ